MIQLALLWYMWKHRSRQWRFARQAHRQTSDHNVSVLSDIPSANTQIWAYLVAWVAVCGIQKSDKAHPAPNRKGFEAEVRDKEKKKNNQ